MRVILAATGTAGDVYPVLGFGRALKARGHEVLVATSGNFTQDVSEADLECIQLIDAETYESIRSSSEQLMARPFYFLRANEFDEAYFRLPELLYRTVEEHLLPGRTVLAATESFTVGAGSIARDKLGVPYVSLWQNVVQFRLLQPLLPLPLPAVEYAMRDLLLHLLPLPRLKRELNRLRASLGLSRIRSMTKDFYCSQQLSVCLFPRWYVNHWYRDRFPNALLTDFPLYEPGQDAALPPDADAFLASGTPPVVFNTASWMEDRREYFGVAVAACEALGLRAVLLGPGSSAFAGRSESVFTADYLPYKRLLPAAAAFVHHGGIGSLARGFAAGVPQLVVPQKNDTRINGLEMLRFGSGMLLRRRYYASRLTQTLDELLASEAIKRNAGNLAAKSAEPPNFTKAAEAIERLLPESARSGSGRPSWTGWSSQPASPS